MYGPTLIKNPIAAWTLIEWVRASELHFTWWSVRLGGIQAVMKYDRALSCLFSILIFTWTKIGIWVQITFSTPDAINIDDLDEWYSVPKISYELTHYNIYVPRIIILFIYICVDHVTSHKKDYISSPFIICLSFKFLFYFLFSWMYYFCR